MKVYVTYKGITLTGKAWEIKTILKQYMKTYTTIKQWQQAVITTKK